MKLILIFAVLGYVLGGMYAHNDLEAQVVGSMAKQTGLDMSVTDRGVKDFNTSYFVVNSAVKFYVQHGIAQTTVEVAK